MKITIEISDQPDNHVGFEGKVTEGTFDPEGPPTGALVVATYLGQNSERVIEDAVKWFSGLRHEVN